MRFRSAAAAALLCLPLPATAATYNFDYVFDGALPALVAGVDDPLGLSLAPGDSFTLTVSAAAGGYWTLLSEVTSGLIAPFLVAESAVRTSSIDTTLLYGGSTVASVADPASYQVYVHLGSQDFNFAAGTIFDTFKVEHTLLTADAFAPNFDGIDPETGDYFEGYIPGYYDDEAGYWVEATIEDPYTGERVAYDPYTWGSITGEVAGSTFTGSFLALTPFYSHPQFAYTAGDLSPIPLPATGLLILSGLGGLGLLRRFRKA